MLQFLQGPPTITLQPSQTVYALIGQRVTLECTADGDPVPSVYWIEPVRRSRGDVPLEPDTYEGSAEYGSAIVDIASVEREDQGTYTCVASNRGGRTEERVQLVGMLNLFFMCTAMVNVRYLMARVSTNPTLFGYNSLRIIVDIKLI